MFKYIILIISLLFTAQSFGYSCPDSTDLNDPSARSKCLYKVLTHYRDELVKDIVQHWQTRYRNVYNNQDITNKLEVIGEGYGDTNVDRLFMFQQLIDKHESTGNYQRPPACPSSSSSSN